MNPQSPTPSESDQSFTYFPIDGARLAGKLMVELADRLTQSVETPLGADIGPMGAILAPAFEQGVVAAAQSLRAGN